MTEKTKFSQLMAKELRAWKLWHRRQPGLLVSLALGSLCRGISPLLTVYVSGRIIAELAGPRDPGQLTLWAVLSLACAAGMTLIQGILSRWESLESWSCGVAEHDRILAEKIQSLDYADTDRQEVRDLHSQILQNTNWGSWGLCKAPSHMRDLVSSLIQILGGLALSIAAFLAPAPGLLGSPVTALGVLALLLGLAILAPALTTKAELYWTKWAPLAREGNRYYSFFCSLFRERERRLDMRIYAQDVLGGAHLQENRSFGPNSGVAAYARGPMGLLTALGQMVWAVITGIIYLYIGLKA